MTGDKRNLLILAALLGVLTVPGIARSQGDKAVVLLSATSMQEHERSAFDAVLETLVAELGPGDRLGAVLYSDIVERVVPLSAISTAVEEEIRAALASASASTEANGAVGLDRAIEELDSLDADKSLLVFSNLGIALSDAEMTGKFTRWRDSVLLPRAARDGIDVLILSSAPVSHEVRSFIERWPSSRALSTTGGSADAVAVALAHVRLQPDPAALPEPTPPESEVAALDPGAPALETDRADVGAADVGAGGDSSPTGALTGSPAAGGVADSVVQPPDSTGPTSVSDADRAPAGEGEGDDRGSVSSPADGPAPAPFARWIDTLTSPAVAPAVLLAVSVFLIVSAAAVYVIGRFGRRDASRHPRDGFLPGRTRRARARSAWEAERSWDENALDDALTSREKGGDERFDALVDTLDRLDGGEEGTAIRPDGTTRNTTSGKPAREDLSREPDDITRKRLSRHDVE